MPFRLVRPLPASLHKEESDARNRPPKTQVLRSRMASSRPLFHFGIVALVGLASLAFGSMSARQTTGASLDQPNPIATTYPNNATGVLNATLVILPIPLSKARRFIPAQWGILEASYRSLMPDFPAGMYPLFLQAGHDHDIQLAALDLKIPDFSRAGFEFPFLDLLGDGYSSFRMHAYQLIAAENQAAIDGSRAYGGIAEPAAFDPPVDAYRRTDSGSLHFSGWPTANPAASLSLDFFPLSAVGGAGEVSPYPLELFKNITNQPSFGNGTVCDNQIRLFHSPLSEGVFAPVPVKGRVSAAIPPFDGAGCGLPAVDLFGLQIATPFIENNYLDCASMKGYSGVQIPWYD